MLPITIECKLINVLSATRIFILDDRFGWQQQAQQQKAGFERAHPFVFLSIRIIVKIASFGMQRPSVVLFYSCLKSAKFEFECPWLVLTDSVERLFQ